MGNTSGRTQTDSSEKNLDELFLTISNQKGYILRSDLRRAWEHQIDKDLYNSVEFYLFRHNYQELSNQRFKNFFFDMCRGTTDQKVEVIIQILGNEDLSKLKLLQFIKSILKSILIIQKIKAPKRYESWSTRLGERHLTQSLNEYAVFFIEKIHSNESQGFSKSDLNLLLNYFDFFLYMVLSRLYDTEDKHFYSHVLPKWKDGLVDTEKTLDQFSVLNLFSIIFINLELPMDYQGHWRPLFSSHVDGESFSRLTKHIVNQGPTIIIIKDKDGHVFGGFAPATWTIGPNFLGDARSFLFTLHPKMDVFHATNFNSNYQYMNISQQTMPNGLGMGGKLEYFGLWIDAEFGRGYCSESCSTYRDYKLMSGSKNFEIAQLEVWGVGHHHSTALEVGEQSVLDKTAEAKAILQLAGKPSYSHGLHHQHDHHHHHHHHHHH